MSKVIPPEGSPRRLNGYLTYAFGYGNAFVIAIDSNIASDTVQLSWVTHQLEGLDRSRYKHVIVFFHHPPYSSGPHSGGSADPVPGTGRKAPDRVEPQSAAIRTSYMPLFRKHHVRLLLTGHDHLYDHWVERYEDAGVTHRIRYDHHRRGRSAAHRTHRRTRPAGLCRRESGGEHPGRTSNEARRHGSDESAPLHGHPA